MESQHEQVHLCLLTGNLGQSALNINIWAVGNIMGIHAAKNIANPFRQSIPLLEPVEPTPPSTI